MTFDFKEYQKNALAASTHEINEAMKPLSLYFAIGLANESGELLGEYKKMLRDDNGIMTDLRRDKMILELGDCLWYLAALMKEVECPELEHIDFGQNLADCIMRSFKYSSQILNGASHFGADGFDIFTDYNALDIYFQHLCNCSTNLNTTIEEVAARNLQKLRERKEEKRLYQIETGILDGRDVIIHPSGMTIKEFREARKQELCEYGRELQLYWVIHPKEIEKIDLVEKELSRKP